MSESDAERASGRAELAVLVELEARWENLRACRTSSGPATLLELQGNQRTYELFHAKLVAYNKRSASPHIPELLLNTTLRLGPWCKKMGALFAELGDGAPCPVHLLEKAYRLADGIARRKGRERAARPSAAGAASAARELENLAAWCAEPTRADVAA